MSDSKKYSPKDAALAVLHKAKEVLEKSELLKAEDAKKMSGKSGLVRLDTQANQDQKGVHQHGYKGTSGGISEAGAKLRDYGSDPQKQRSKYGKDQASHVKEIHKEVLGNLKAMPKPNLGKSDESEEGSDFKGHIKLAKFMGHMEHKRSKKAE